MKCIIYISRVINRQNGAAVPTSLSTIYRLAQKRNTEHNITGIISYRKGYYIQVLEGEEAKIDQLYSNIVLDSRHQRVTRLLDIKISSRSFPDWNMKLLTSVSKDPTFSNFMRKYSSAFSGFTTEKRKLLSHFYNLDQEDSLPVRSYSGKNISLISWPDFRLIKQSPNLIDLCARLTSSPQPYQELNDSGEFGTKQDLDFLLRQFEGFGILRLTESLHYRKKVQPDYHSNQFYRKMKTFLRRS